MDEVLTKKSEHFDVPDTESVLDVNNNTNAEAITETTAEITAIDLVDGEPSATLANNFTDNQVEATYEETTPVAEAANYQESWFNLQHERMQSPEFRDKFKRFIKVHVSSMSLGAPQSSLDKPEHFQAHYQQQLGAFDDNLNNVYSSVKYGLSREVGGKTPGGLGHGKISQPGTLYSDAINQDGTPLTDRQKDIIAGHEAYHGMVDTQGSASQEVKSGFDWQAYDDLVDTASVKRPNYLRNSDELLARMAQFKNYFGMRGADTFQAEHLQYLRAHYVKDTGLDNGISVMLSMITPGTEAQFIKLMNQLPI